MPTSRQAFTNDLVSGPGRTRRASSVIIAKFENRRVYMRLVIVGWTLVCLGLAIEPAAAQKSYSRRGYSSCYCDYGYPGTNCVPAVSCATEGGRCRKPCIRQ